jgi:hypothetical protein
MADSFTFALNLCKPEIDQSAETWGQKLNNDLDLIDTFAGEVQNFMGSAGDSGSAAIAAAIANAVPKGTIVAWFGQPNAVPSGWHICDGNGGTPNLTDRFIMGTAGLQAVGAVGGSDHWSVTSQAGGVHDHLSTVIPYALTPAQMPQHKHGGGTDLQGYHGHTVAGNNGQFVVAGSGIAGNLPGGGGYTLAPSTDGNGAHSHYVDTDWQGGGQSHTHAINLEPGHTHTVNGPMTPAYVALVYIMRL